MTSQWQCKKTWASHQLKTSPEVWSGWRDQLAKGAVLAVWAAAVNSKFSVKEKAWHINSASGLVLHEAGIEAHLHLASWPLCALPALHIGQDLSGPELPGIRTGEYGRGAGQVWQ